MEKYPSEIFGHPHYSHSEKALVDRETLVPIR